MDMKQTADVSRFMLFEATGDSEADCSCPVMNDQVGYGDGIARAHVVVVDDDDDDDDDDAESCSYDGSENQNCNLQGEQLHRYGSCELDYEHDEEKKKDEEEARVSYGTSYCDDDDEIQKRHNSILSVDSGQHLMDEMEKDRLFWEACLAS